MDDRDLRPKNLLQFFVPRKWKAKGRACVFDSARPTAAMIFQREEEIRQNDVTH